MKDVVRADIYSRQYLSNYENVKFIIFNMDHGGFGAMFARRKLALQFGLYFNRVVLFSYGGYVYDEPFEEVSNFTLKDVNKEPLSAFRYETNQSDKVVYFNFYDYWNRSDIRNKYHERSMFDINFIEFSGILLNSLKLKQEYQDALDIKTKELLPNNNKIIGLHIRRGDKEVESPFIPVDVYIEELKRIQEATGIGTVYVCSDSSIAIKELEQKLTGFEIIYDKQENRHNNKINNINMVLESPSLAKIETFNCIKNIYLLTKCDYIVGQSNVQFAKLAACKMSDNLSRLDKHTLINPTTLQKVIWDD